MHDCSSNIEAQQLTDEVAPGSSLSFSLSNIEWTSEVVMVVVFDIGIGLEDVVVILVEHVRMSTKRRLNLDVTIM